MQKPIRILHSIPGYGMGGIESLIMSLYQHLDKTKVQFDLLVETPQWLADFDVITENGGKVYQLNAFNKLKPWKFTTELKAFFKLHNHKFDVLHSHTITRSAPVLYYAKKNNINCRISHAHTDCLDGNKFIALSELLIRLNNRLSTHYLAASNQAGRYYFEKDKKDFTVLKNSIDTNNYYFNQEIRKSTRQSMNLDDAFVIGHTGRFTYQKNHWKILNVFKEVLTLIPHAHLLLVGDGPNMNEIKDLSEQLGIQKSIRFTGSRSDVPDLLQAMDVFLLPSFFEGFCISLLEAQAVGLPCIASDIIPNEVQITNLVTTCALNQSNKNWALTIQKLLNKKRKSHHQKVIDQGYDTKNNAKWLENYYLSQLND